jgi:hypothetical protein
MGSQIPQAKLRFEVRQPGLESKVYCSRDLGKPLHLFASFCSCAVTGMRRPVYNCTVTLTILLKDVLTGCCNHWALSFLEVKDLFIYSFNKYFLSTYFVSNTVLGIIAVLRTDMIPSLIEHSVLCSWR